MYTSDIDAVKEAKQKRTLQKTWKAYVAVILFCVIFPMIYERFSYGEWALCMRLMFLAPLIGGAVMISFLLIVQRKGRFNRMGYNLWNSGIAAITSGCMVKGIIEISGRSTDYDGVYWFCGEVLLLLAIIFFVGSSLRNKQ